MRTVLDDYRRDIDLYRKAFLWESSILPNVFPALRGMQSAFRKERILFFFFF